MVHQFKAAVFDLDGTLLDTSDGILTSVKYTVRKLGLEPLDEETYRTFIGPPVQKSFARYYGLEGKKLEEAAFLFRERYKEKDLLKARPYEGIYELLKKLRQHGIVSAVATYKRQDYAVTLLRHFVFHQYIDIMCGSDFENKLRKQDIIENALRRAGVHDYTEAVMVGDTDQDAAGAEELGVPFIGVTYGFGFQSKQDVFPYQTVGMADTPLELADIIIGGQK